MRDWILIAKLGGRYLSSAERVRIVSSRGARGLYGPGRFRFWRSGPIELICNSGKTHDLHALCAGVGKSFDACAGGRSARVDIVH